MRKAILVSIMGVCAILNCNKATFYRWLREGILPFNKIKIGQHKVGFLYSDVVDYIESQIVEEVV
jgi:excisionase family DNA binding protein